MDEINNTNHGPDGQAESPRQASPRPWRQSNPSADRIYYVYDANGDLIQAIADHRDGADTTLIVQAVNAHDDLVGLLAAVERWMTSRTEYELIALAIAAKQARAALPGKGK